MVLISRVSPLADCSTDLPIAGRLPAEEASVVRHVLEFYRFCAGGIAIMSVECWRTGPGRNIAEELMGAFALVSEVVFNGSGGGDGGEEGHKKEELELHFETVGKFVF